MGKFFSTLRSRLVLIVVLTSIPGIIILFETGLDHRKQAVAAAQQEVIHLTRVASNTQSMMVNNVKAFLLTLAHLPSLRQNDITGCQDLFSHLVDEHFQYYASFYVSDLNGNIVCSPPDKHTPDNFDDCSHYRELVQASDYVISNYHICEHTGKAVLSIGYPIMNMQDQPILVTSVSLDLVWFYDIAADANLPEGSKLILLDGKGTILSYFPENDKWRGLPLPQSGAVGELFAQKTGVVIGPGLEGEESLYAISAMEGTKGQIYVILGRPTRLAFAEANQTLRRNMLLLILAAAGVIVLMWFVGDALIVNQAQALVQATRRLAGGDLSTRTGLNYERGELGELARAFDGMAVDLASREAERDRSQAALAEYTRNLEHANQELRDFTNIASHDLQEPLRKIQIFGGLLEERYAKDLDARALDYIRRMEEAARRMQTLASELLAYSRVTAKTNPPVQVDLTETVRQVLQDLDWQIDQLSARVELSDLPVVEADPVQMTQLFQNLITNALKFHPKDRPPVVRIFAPDQVKTRDGSGGPICEIHIADEGIGFDEKYLDRIFQPFQRLHGREEYEGTGMGLAICRKIVDRHGGSITARSVPQQGATFIVRLPIQQRQERADAPGMPSNNV